MPQKTKIYDITTRLLMLVLALFMVTIAVRFAARFVMDRTGERSALTDAIFFDAPELAGTEKETLPPENTPENTPEDTQAPAEPWRDADGIVWSTVIDWAALYPADDAEEEALPEPTGAERFAARFRDAVERIDARTAPFEARVGEKKALISSYATKYAVFYNKMVELAKAYDGTIGWEIVGTETYNPVLMIEDNYFYTAVARTDETAHAEKIAALDAYCASLGTEHLYVLTPNNVCREDTGVNDVTDFYNQNADRLLAALDRSGVATFDLRDALHADGMDHHASFYQTDHHWLPDTGLWAAGRIAGLLNEEYGFAIDLDLLAPGQFRHEVYEKAFLGSQGKKVTLSRAEPEDFSLLYPTFDTDLRIEIPSLDVDKTGDFSIFYRYDPVNGVDYYNKNPYSAYFYGDNALTRVTNHAVQDGKRILVLGHSFDNCVIPFLALGVERIDSIDLRSFTGSLETYLREEHYDLVIELYTE